MADDDELFLRALEATQPDVSPPKGFSDDVLRALAERDSHGAVANRRQMRWSRPLGWGALGIVAVAAAALVVFGNPRESRSFVATGALPLTVQVGTRAVVVADPGSRGRYESGGVMGGPDVVWLDRGAAFFRVEKGGAFEVRTPFGRVRVTGTCFDVAVRPRERNESMGTIAAVSGHAPAAGRAKWFGAGALSAALVVMVYEGGVHVAGAHGSSGRAVAPGEAVAVSDEGVVASLGRVPARAGRGDTRTVDTITGHDAPRADEADAARHAALSAATAEVARLRELLVRNDISPETGQHAPQAQRRGIEDDGNTDLTADEWRTLAARGELRFRLPELSHGHLGDRLIEANGLSPDETSRLEGILGSRRDALQDDVRRLYREAVGADPGAMSFSAMMSEIQDKTPEQEASRIRWVLAQERAGLSAPPPPDADLSPYERMMRRLVGFEAELERAFAQEVGPEDAHAVLFGEPAINAHSYGMSGNPSE